MIVDRVENSLLYEYIHPRLKMAFDFIKNKAHSLEIGKYEIDGKNVFATISYDLLRTMSSAKLEAHNEYIDIQAILIGRETYGVAQRFLCDNPISPFDSKKDIQFFDDKITDRITIIQGMFIMFFPADAHAPLIGKSGELVRKVVVKVRI